MRCLSILAVLGVLGLLAGAAADEPKGWGTVKGQVFFGGIQIPQPKDIAVEKDREHCESQGKLKTQDWVINSKNKGVRWTFVWLAPVDPIQKKIPIHPDLQAIKEKSVVMDQPCCMFEPRALGMREGQVLIAKNSAPVAHNFKHGGHPAINPGANPQIPPKEQYEVKNLKADRIPVMIECTQHPWMKGWVRVFDHPYFAVTDADGNFEIKKAPAGEYRLLVWHEAIGYADIEKGPDGKSIFGRKITIKPDGTVEEKVPLKP